MSGYRFLIDSIYYNGLLLVCLIEYNFAGAGDQDKVGDDAHDGKRKMRKTRKNLTEVERNEMIHLLREPNFDIESIAKRFDCCTRTVYKEQRFLKMAIVREEIEKYQLGVLNHRAVSQNVLHAGGTAMVARHIPYSARAPSSSLLTKARGDHIHQNFEVRGRSQQFADPNNSSIPYSAFHDCRRLLSYFDSACPRWDHRLIRPSAQDGMESTVTNPGLEPGAYTGGSAATVSALPVRI